MSSFLNSIFFIKRENLNIANVLNVLQTFMFTKINQTMIMLKSKFYVKNIVAPLQIENIKTIETIENVLVITEPAKGPVISEELISPKQNDTLFWCLFIIHYGYDEYIEVDRNYGVKELEIKKKIGYFITSNPHKMKSTNYKITKIAVQEILSELLTSQKDTSMNSLLAILVYYNINLIMVNSTKLLMLEFISNKDVENQLPTYVIYKDTYGKYSLKTEPLTKDQVDDLKNKTICLDSYLKPLKAISNYKVEELETLAKKMGLFESGKKYKKTDLYQEITEACQFN